MTTRDFTHLSFFLIFLFFIFLFFQRKDTNLSQWPLMKYQRNAERNLNVFHNISKHYETLPCYPFNTTVQSRNATFLRAYCKSPVYFAALKGKKNEVLMFVNIMKFYSSKYELRIFNLDQIKKN